jgi:hypothetical protein
MDWHIGLERRLRDAMFRPPLVDLTERLKNPEGWLDLGNGLHVPPQAPEPVEPYTFAKWLDEPMTFQFTDVVVFSDPAQDDFWPPPISAPRGGITFQVPPGGLDITSPDRPAYDPEEDPPEKYRTSNLGLADVMEKANNAGESQFEAHQRMIAERAPLPRPGSDEWEPDL